MNLDEAQRKKVTEWIDQGLKLSEIQSRISTEFQITLTYMEMRFLLDDLALKPKDEPKLPPLPKAAAAPGSPQRPSNPASAGAGEPLDDLVDEELPAASGNVSVSVDEATRPGTMVSGKVTFSDAQTAEWYLDQTGRLGLAPKQPGYKPSQQDIMDFQAALQNELAKIGF